MKRLILFTILILAFVFSSNAPQSRAQTAQPKCDLSAVFKEAAALTTTGENQKDMTALLKLRDEISQANVVCNGWTLKGDTKTKRIIGPIQISDGIYKATATTTGYLILDQGKRIKLETEAWHGSDPIQSCVLFPPKRYSSL
jgi:hypothetical protein